MQRQLIVVLLVTWAVMPLFSEEATVNTIMDWEISQAYPAHKIDLAKMNYPRFYTIFFSKWQKVTPDPSGLVNIAQIHKRDPKARKVPQVVLARTIFNVDKRQDIRLSFGYCEEAAIYFNGKKVFYGNSINRNPGKSLPSITDFRDSVYLTLQKGRNEIFLLVKENSGVWGFACKTDSKLAAPVKKHARLKKVWETKKVLLTPESVLYDAKRDILYVTSFDNRYNKNAKPGQYTGYISRVTTDGQIDIHKWVTGLHAPAGLCMVRDKLYTVERKKLVEIDVDSGKIVKRYDIPDADFPNDIAADAKGNIYISDTSPSSHIDSRIYRFRRGMVDVWVDGDEIYRANGLFVYRNKLLVGNSGDCSLKAIDIATKKIDKVATFGAGIVDGIRVDSRGNYLVSLWEGLVFLVSRAGQVTEVLDVLPQNINTADFEFIKKKKLLVIPTFTDNRVIAYELVD